MLPTLPNFGFDLKGYLARVCLPDNQNWVAVFTAYQTLLGNQ